MLYMSQVVKSIIVISQYYAQIPIAIARWRMSTQRNQDNSDHLQSNTDQLDTLTGCVQQSWP